MLIIGKYFETSKDYVNAMNVAKRYQQLTNMYHFNPISEYELFENMQTQYLNGPEDKKKSRMHQYVYWYDPCKKLEKNEIYKRDPFRYVTNNIEKLEEWSKKI